MKIRNSILGLGGLIMSLVGCDGRQVTQQEIDGGLSRDAQIVMADSVKQDIKVGSDIEELSANLDNWANGTSVTPTCSGKPYKIQTERIRQDYTGGKDGARFHLNNGKEVTGILEKGDSYITADGKLKIKVTDTIYQAYAGGNSKVEFKMICNKMNKASSTLNDWVMATSATPVCSGKRYQIWIERIRQDYAGGKDGARFHINQGKEAETSSVLERGDTYTTKDGNLRIKVTDTKYQDYAGGVNTVTFDMGCK
jgi:hypothetical protein|tara:strand:+ start:1207 stop:1965 length:759 start_codon:yes stop_codon:yes gene_type:complete